ncbi:154R [Cherax quadricarinatus iridovirus]|uniref:DNA-binding packing protein n=1 Tax=Shrimp hemocyte iridescent virus TaxID=2039780 RepID=A0A291B0K1_9VIRU|nr:154R [Cherax quadricarinatus iridovirus]YP_010084754.1 DNA-binding packing protein [Shrimp hemocyte iridescent virus]UPA43299.1 DNA-binding packing protein [Iridovirus CN01]ASZ85134.1 154R [Cherax quadricarinatus iridovirus]ATE87011.1 DNA-binding packing protein [Shrimp hemocyte iridescent virus]UPA43534.1 DNA-binding packing protein [Iridovirus CN01]UPA43731.1 DNA-binding packing protein [Iridovirus CN01]
MKNEIHIFLLNSRILEKISTEEKEKKLEIETLSNLLKVYGNSLDECVFDEIERTILRLKEENLYLKPVFISCTYEILEEYYKILKNPISHDFKKNLPILNRKRQLVINFLEIVRKFKNENNWTDIEIPQNPENLDVDFYCSTCGNTDDDKFETDENNIKTCLKCSTQHHLIETGVTHKDFSRVNFVNKFVYKRTLHFQDCLKQYQGKQNCKVPEKVYTDLENKFRAYRLLIDDENTHVKYSKITRNHINTFLKELKYTKQYENVNLIYTTLTNKHVDDIGHLETQLIEDFKELISLYEKTHGKGKPDELPRKNFMNIQYILFQLLRRHGHPCNTENFTFLKTIDRKIFHDKICKQLFEKLGWKFTPTF